MEKNVEEKKKLLDTLEEEKASGRRKKSFLEEEKASGASVGYKSQKRKRKEVQRLLKQPITDMPDIPKSQYELNMEKNVEEKKNLLDTLEIDLD